MKRTPTRDALEWASFNTRFRLLLEATPVICFWLVVAGSIYGIHKSIQSQYPGAGLIIAAIVAAAIQSINAVCVHFTTRSLASLFTRQFNSANKHQRVNGVDTAVGGFTLLLTIAICWFDFVANKEASAKAADMLVTAPTTEKVDTATHAIAINAARAAVSAEQAAEQAERAAYESKVDSDINAARKRLTSRQAHLHRLSPIPAWAISELRQITSQLNGLEAERKARKAGFVAKKADVAGAQKKFAEISSTNANMLLGKQMQADSTNTARGSLYEQKKETYTGAMFWVYVVAMLLWHLAEGLKQYRALRYDEQHSHNGNPAAAIANTLRDGIANMMWRINARIMQWMPEDEIHGISRTDLLAQTNTAVCQAVYQLINQQPGINEVAVYTRFRNQYEPQELHQALRLLKTARLCFESSGTWTADSSQAAFFLPTDGGSTDVVMQQATQPRTAPAQSLSLQEEEIDEDFIQALIDGLLIALKYTESEDEKINIHQQIDGLKISLKYVNE